MYIARWHLTAHFGKVDDALSILKRWQIDVAERVGWRASHVRVTTGAVGAASNHIEVEVRADSLADLEAAWADLEKNPHHHELRRQLGHVVAGEERWSIYRERDLTP